MSETPTGRGLPQGRQYSRMKFKPSPNAAFRRVQTEAAKINGAANRMDWLVVLAIETATLPQIFGDLGAAVLAALSLVLWFRAPRAYLDRVRRLWPLLALPLFAMASTLWSDDPAKSLRTSLFFLLGCATGVLIATRVRPAEFVKAMFLACLIISIVSLASGRKGAAIDGDVPVGLMGAKNGFSFLGQALLAAALAAFVGDGRRPVLRLASIGSIPLALYILYATESAGGVLSAIIATGVFGLLFVIGGLPRNGRILTCIFLAIVVLACLVAWKDLQQVAQDILFRGLHKDSTLTGRGYLWYRAQTIMQQRPILGHGYSAFWTQGNMDAEGLWRWDNIVARSGFNFHNTPIELRVDLGWVGLALLAIISTTTAVRLAYVWLMKPSTSLAYLIATLVAILARMSAESIYYTATPLICTIAAFAWLERVPTAIKPRVGNFRRGRGGAPAGSSTTTFGLSPR